MISPLIAAKAYAAVQSQASPLASAAAGASASAPPPGQDFAHMVQGAIDEAVKSSRTAESQMSAQVQGKAQLVDVVTAISSAQTTLQTVLAVRDEVISAYKEIMAMTI
ncbi:MAG TPA: flagellar hook-basal body complex protein FliE [Caulobacteraceae bacterium]|nr:flagellar hook-basal body complex protein FliE [Caulobacteraceae bacterium]